MSQAKQRPTSVHAALVCDTGHAVPHPLTACERATTVDASPASTPYSTIRCLGNVATLAAPVITLLRTRTGQPHACSYCINLAGRRLPVVDGAAPNHVSLRRARMKIGRDHATYPYDGNATFQNRIQGHKRTISQLRAHLIKAHVTIPHYNVLTL